MTKATLTHWIERFKSLESETERVDFLGQVEKEIKAESAGEVQQGVHVLREQVADLEKRVAQAAQPTSAN